MSKMTAVKLTEAERYDLQLAVRKRPETVELVVEFILSKRLAESTRHA